MTQTTILPAVKVCWNSDVFYGTFMTKFKDKHHDVMVSYHIKDVTKTYNFRSASKCKAGFVNIQSFESTPVEAISNWKKNALLNLQVEVEYESGAKQWLNVYTIKNGKWHSIDRGFLEVLTVGMMRSSFPDMCDMNLWKLVGAKTWADNAFTNNQKLEPCNI